VGYETSEQSDVVVVCGPGTTLTTVTQQGGDLTINSAATTITKSGGDLTCMGTGAYTTVKNWRGELIYRSSGTITNFSCGAATVDFRADMRAKTITNCDLYAGANVQDPQGVVTWTNGLDLNACDQGEVTLNLGKNIRLTPAAL
jgi:hypothetical protein